MYKKKTLFNTYYIYILLHKNYERLDSFGFGSVRIVKLGTKKYPEKNWFLFGSGSSSDSSDS